MIYNQDSLALPVGLQQLMPSGAQTNNQAYGSIAPTQQNSGVSTMDFRQQPKPSYAEGGEVGEGGIPVAPQAGPGGMPPGGAPQGAGLAAPGAGPQRMNANKMEMEMQRFMQDNPEKVAQIKNEIMRLLQSGELTQQELNMVVQLSTVALQNPDMYPQVRQFAIQQGLATEAEISPEYDEGLIFVLLLGARAVGQESGGNFAGGGMIHAGTGPKADDVNINVSKGEFVIPADVVKAKGTDFFENLVKPKGSAKG